MYIRYSIACTVYSSKRALYRTWHTLKRQRIVTDSGAANPGPVPTAVSAATAICSILWSITSICARPGLYTRRPRDFSRTDRGRCGRTEARHTQGARDAMAAQLLTLALLTSHARALGSTPPTARHDRQRALPVRPAIPSRRPGGGVLQTALGGEERTGGEESRGEKRKGKGGEVEKVRKDNRREEERGGAHGQDAGVAIDAGEQKRPDRVGG